MSMEVYFHEGQKPNVRLAYRVVKRKSVPCIVAKRAIKAGEYLTLSYEMPYWFHFRFSTICRQIKANWSSSCRSRPILIKLSFFG